MSISEQNSDLAVDRRDETVTTKQPGYASTERFTRDVAEERRIQYSQVIRIIWAVLGLLELLLGLRFLLKLMAANAQSGFGSLIYGVSGVFTAPFAGLFSTPASGGTVLEMTTLVAMLIYALFFWIVVKVIRIVADRPSSRMATRSVHEQMPDGSDRTVRTTKIG